MRHFRFTPLVAVGALILTTSIGLWLFRGSRPITFNVTANTERVRYRTGGDGMPVNRTGDTLLPARVLWTLDDVEFPLELPTPRVKAPFTGYFEPKHPIEVIIERVAKGPLYVEVKSLSAAGSSDSARSVGRLLDEQERSVAVFGSHMTFFAKDLERRALAGSTIILPLTGLVEAGVDLGVRTRGTSAALRSGHVTMQGRSILDNTVFEAGHADLAAGDQFKVENLKDHSLGFVLVDQEPGMTAAFRSVAEHGVVVRPGGGEHRLHVSLFDQIIRDRLSQIVTALAAIIGALAGIAKFVKEWVGADRSENGRASLPLTSRLFGRRRKVPTTTLTLLLVLVGTADAQQGVFVKAGEMGQGVLRRRVETCFVLLPAHVVERAGGNITVIGERGTRGVAVLERTFEGDLAMLRLRENKELSCPEWTSGYYRAIARVMGIQQAIPAGSAYLRIIEESGSETRRLVDVRSSDEQYITVRPRSVSDEITQTMSGASLMVGNEVRGILLRVCPKTRAADNPCTPGDADVLKLDAMAQLTDAFFEVSPVNPAVARAQAQQAEGQAAVTRVQDSLAMVYRRGKAPQLPRLVRDVYSLNLYAWNRPIALPCAGNRCRDAARVEAWANDRGIRHQEISPRYLYVILKLSRPIQSTAPQLPAILASCTLLSSAGRVRDFSVLTQDSVMGIGAAWDDPSKPPPFERYWAECKVDGQSLETAGLTVAAPRNPVNVFSSGMGQSSLRLKAVEIGLEGERPKRFDNPGEGDTRLTIATPTRRDAPFVVTMEWEQVSGTPLSTLARTFVEDFNCAFAGANTSGAVTSTQVRPGTWRLSRRIAPLMPWRWQAGEYPGECRAPAGSLIDFVVEMR